MAGLFPTIPWMVLGLCFTVQGSDMGLHTCSLRGRFCSQFGHESAQLDLFVASLHESKVRLSQSLDKPDTAFLCNRQPKYFRVYLPYNFGSGDPVLDEK